MSGRFRTKLFMVLALGLGFVTPVVARTGNTDFSTRDLKTPVVNSQFRVENDILFVSGTIKGGAAKAFNEVINFYKVNETLPNIKYVALDSEGGSFDDAVEMVLTIQKEGIETIAVNKCDSACAYIWLAGAKHYKLNDAEVSIHPPYYSNSMIVSPEGATSMGWLVAKLGLSSNVAYAIGFIPSRALMELTPKVLDKWGVEVIEITKLPK